MTGKRERTLLKRALGAARHRALPWIYHGSARVCPVCGKSSRRFMPGGETAVREEAECVHCGSLERQRLLWLFLLQRSDLFTRETVSMLHVAPEPCLEAPFRRLLGDGYLTADLLNPKAMVKMDIMDIDFPDNTFDAIYCSHVFEHVADDRKAMREFLRTLKPCGWAILLVPIDAEATYEDASLTTPEQRLAAFGQADHVRSYGPDYINRLQDAGFHVERVRPCDLVGEEDLLRYGLGPEAGDIYYCTKTDGDR